MKPMAEPTDASGPILFGTRNLFGIHFKTARPLPFKVILAKPRAEVCKEKRTYRKWLRNTHLNLLSFDFCIEICIFSTLLLKPLIFLYSSNLHFVLTFLFKFVLSLYFPFEISTSFSISIEINFLFVFKLKSLLSLYFSIVISTFSLNFVFLLKSLLSFYISSENFYVLSYVLSTCLLKLLLFNYLLNLLKSILSLNFSIEIVTWDFLHTQRCSLQLLPLLQLRTPKFQSNSYAQHYTQPGTETAPKPRRNRAATARNGRLKPPAFTTVRTQIYCENTGVRTSPYFQTCMAPRLQHKLSPLDWATLLNELRNCELRALPLTAQFAWTTQLWATAWLLYNLTGLFNDELRLDCSATCLNYSTVNYLLVTLPLDWAIVSYLLSILPLDGTIQLWTIFVYSTNWLSYSMVSYLLVTLQLDSAIQVWITSGIFYLLTELSHFS